MEKVKLTQKQADLIKDIKDIDYAINIHGFNKRPDSPLQRLTTAELARALYIGYEVEPEFKVGDWVFIDYGEAGTEIGFIKGWINEPHSFYIDKCHFGANVNKARHATPEEIAKEKERRWWAKHGRDVWEIKLRDLLTHKRHKFVREIVGIQDGEYITNPNNERFTKQELQGLFNIACFAEDRKDV